MDPRRKEMDDYLTLLATLLGAVLGGAIGFASAYLIERQRFKREKTIEMRDKIYGPIYMAVSKTLDVIKLFQSSYDASVSSLKQSMDNYLFFTIKQDLKSKLYELVDRLGKYERIRAAAELVFFNFTRELVKEKFEVDIGSGANPVLRLLIGKTMASGIDLETAVFLKQAPRNFISKEKQKWGEDIELELNMRDKEKSLENFELLYSTMLDKMEKEPLYPKEREQRMRLIEELESVLGQVEAFVKP